jgi:hypothetical protein
MALVGDRRRDPRTIIMARAEALWVDSAGMPHAAPGMLEETSPGGACMRLKEPVSVGSKITITWRREQFSGTVRHIKNEEFDFIVGIQRDAVVPAGHPRPDAMEPPQPARTVAQEPGEEIGKS